MHRWKQKLGSKATYKELKNVFVRAGYINYADTIRKVVTDSKSIILLYFATYTVEPPKKGHFGNGPLVLCSEVVPISEVHDFSTHFDCIILE